MIYVSTLGIVFIGIILFTFIISIFYLKFKKSLKVYDLSNNLVMADKDGADTEAYVKIGEHKEETIDISAMKFDTNKNITLHFHA